MLCATDPSRDLLFGLLALQNGLIEQGQLVAAFQSWTRDKSRPMADHLMAYGDLDPDQRAAVEALVDLHLKKHGGDPEKSLAVVSVGRSTRERLAHLADADLEASLAHVGSGVSAAPEDIDRTASYAVGAVTADGQRFRVLRPHAQGGLGAVFVALDCELHREVALKRILDQHADDHESRHRFLQEAEITGGLEHPGIVPVYGLGSYADGRPYYAMRLIRGDSLKEAIARFHADSGLKQDPGQRTLELHQLLRRFVDICNAIDYAHSRGVLHRDLKPGNVIVGRYGETLVVDWGLAKPLGHAEPSGRPEERTLVPSSGSGTAGTLPGSALGTPAYMSPEQAAGDLEHLGPRSDVYSLGATLYCLLTGRAPFEGDDLGEILRGVQAGDFPAPRVADPTIDRALEAVCLKAMARAPEDRYATPRALAEDVERWKADEPVSAWREPFSLQSRRWLRRHRTLVTAAAAVLVMALAGLGSVAGVQAKANRDLNQANRKLKASNEALAAANAQVRQANADLEAANERVAARFDLAMEAIGKFHTGVSKDLLLSQSEFKDLRTQLLREAQAYYDKVLDLLKDRPDELSRQALGRTYYQFGELLSAIDTQDKALNAHHQGLDVRRELANQSQADDRTIMDYGYSLWKTTDCLKAMGRNEEAMTLLERGLDFAKRAPNGRAHRALQAMMDHQIGLLQMSADKRSEALASFNRALAYLEHPEQQPPYPTAEGRRAKAILLSHLGELEEREGHLEKAVALQRKYLGMMQKLYNEEPKDPEIRLALVNACLYVGKMYAQAGWVDGSRGKESIAALLEAQELLRRWIETEPNNRTFQWNLALVQHYMSFLHVATGRLDQALASLGDVVRLSRAVADADPSALFAQGLLVQSLQFRGIVLEQMDRPADALTSYEEAQAVMKRDEPRWQQASVGIANQIGNLRRRRTAGGLASRGLDLAHSGHPAQAVTAYRQAIKVLEALERHLTVDLALDDFHLACYHARLAELADTPNSDLTAAEGRAERDLGMESFRTAVDRGFRDLDRIRADTDLDPLRARTDFQLLMLDMAFPDDPFAP